jgi:hypothetical protein
MIKGPRVFLVAASLFSVTAWGQLSEVVVTGSRISGDDYSRTPTVVMQRRADFIVQSVLLTNDTRDKDARTRELYQTIRDMVSDASKRPGIALGYGDDFLIPITAAAYDVPLSSEGRKPDTSATEIYVKMALNEKDDVLKAIASLRAFIKAARVSGRTEVQPQGDVGLSLVDPEKYRFEIISKITEDEKRVKASVGQTCKLKISGLSNRVSWQRSDISELTLYIPYQVELADCQ